MPPPVPSLQVLPGLPPGQISALLGALASLKLSREDTLGVRPTLSAPQAGSDTAAAPLLASPTPEEFAGALLMALQPHLGAMAPDQMSLVGARLSILGSSPPGAWARGFLSAFRDQLDRASPLAVVQLLAALPALAPDASSVPEGWVRSCLEKVGREGKVELSTFRDAWSKKGGARGEDEGRFHTLYSSRF